jgi:hypothetical protein
LAQGLRHHLSKQQEIKMKIKTSELKGAPLNWAVAQILELPLDDLRRSRSVVFYLSEPWMPDIYWEQGGPIIEEQEISLERISGALWVAAVIRADKEYGGVKQFEEDGPTPLIAAMRCYVASELGDEIEVPYALG